VVIAAATQTPCGERLHAVGVHVAEGHGGEGPSGELKRMHTGGISNASARARISASQRSAFTFVLASSTYRRTRLQKPLPFSGW
jgi:hypothetical protein